MIDPCIGSDTVSEQTCFVNYTSLIDQGPPCAGGHGFEFHPTIVSQLIKRCPKIPARITGDSDDLVGAIVLETLIYVQKLVASGTMSQHEAQQVTRLMPILKGIARRHFARALVAFERQREVSLDNLSLEPYYIEDHADQLESNNFTAKVRRIMLGSGASQARTDAFLLSAIYGYNAKEILGLLERMYGAVINEATLLKWRSRDKAKLFRLLRSMNKWTEGVAS